jgi:hypothetical protein
MATLPAGRLWQRPCVAEEFIANMLLLLTGLFREVPATHFGAHPDLNRAVEGPRRCRSAVMTPADALPAVPTFSGIVNTTNTGQKRQPHPA